VSVQGLVAAVGVCALGASGCYTHDCDATNVPYTQGDLRVTDGIYLYETTPPGPVGPVWLNFAGLETLVVTYPPDIAATLSEAGVTPATWEAWTGTSDAANAEGGNNAFAAGNAAEFSNVTTTGFAVTNAACASYSARFVVTFWPPPVDAGSPDATGD
jgi:hypothetical protein